MRISPDQRLSGTDIGLPLVTAVGSIRSRSAQRIAWHSHGGFELIFLLEGATAYEFQGSGVLELSGGQFILVPANARHRGRQDVRMPSVLCGILLQPGRRNAEENSPFTASDLARMSRLFCKWPAAVRTMNRELRSLIMRLAEAVRAFRQRPSSPVSKPQLRSMICLAIMEATQLLTSRERAGATELVAAARVFLREHHGDSICMNDLASHLGLSRARMFEIFKTRPASRRTTTSSATASSRRKPSSQNHGKASPRSRWRAALAPASTSAASSESTAVRHREHTGRNSCDRLPPGCHCARHPSRGLVSVRDFSQ